MSATKSCKKKHFTITVFEMIIFCKCHLIILIIKGIMELPDEERNIRRRLAYMARYGRRERLTFKRATRSSDAHQYISALNILRRDISKHARFQRKICIINKRFTTRPHLKLTYTDTFITSVLIHWNLNGM